MTCTQTPVEEMQKRILHAYDHPDEQACFYSGNVERTGSTRLDHLPYWDWSCQPARSVPSNTTCLFPLALNCPQIHTTEGKLWVNPIFEDEDEEDFILELPDIRSGFGDTILQEMATMARDLPAGETIREVDIQSSLGIAELVCGQNLYIALLEEPEAIKKMLTRITDFVIDFVHEMRRVCGPRLNGAGFPFIWSDQHSTLVSDDTLTLVSPQQHLEFSLPYVNQFADACGPIHYHSCSWYERFFDNIKQVRNVRTYNWNTGNSDDPHHIIREFSGRAVLAPHICKDMHLSNDVARWGHSFSDEVDLLSYVLDGMLDNTSFHFWLGEFDEKPDVLERMYDILHERGYSPQAQLG